jgi:hypothetical protein
MHTAPALSVLGQLLVCENSGSVKENPEIVIGNALTLVSVSCDPTPTVPIVVGPKSMLSGEICKSEKIRPIPERFTFAGDPDPENGICRFPEENPFPVGAKSTVIRQLAPASSTVPQLFEIEKGPETEGAPRLSGAGVELKRVTILGMPGTPGYCPPKVRPCTLTDKLFTVGVP